MEMTVEFVENLPEAKRGGRKMPLPVWEACKERPNEWAILKKNFKGGIQSYQKAHPGFEFATRVQPDKSVTCFTRYVETKPAKVQARKRSK